MQGHVDGIGRVTRLTPEGENWWLSVRVPQDLRRYVTEKGSIALDGISLTVARWHDGIADIAIIPFTYAHTNVRSMSVNDAINIETDILAKYVESLLHNEKSQPTIASHCKTPRRGRFLMRGHGTNPDHYSHDARTQPPWGGSRPARLSAGACSKPMRLTPPMTDRKSYDVAVIGAGIFGAWTAYYLAKSGASVALLDAYGPANSRASSGGESRIIRMGYGADEIYTRWSLRALPRWKEIFAAAGRPELFQPTGVLWIAHDKYPYAMDTLTALQNHEVPHERLSLMGLRKHYPKSHLMTTPGASSNPKAAS